MNDNKVIKVLRIITLTLSMMLLVFALAKKVGLCASDSGSSGFTSFPLPISFSYGLTPEQAQVLSQLDLDGLMSTTDSIRKQSSVGYDTACLVDWVSSNEYVIGFYHSSWTTTVNTESLNNTTYVHIGSWPQGITAGIKYYNGNFDYWWGNLDCTINFNNHLTSLPDGNYQLNSNEFISYYPFYSQADSISTTSDSFLLFSKNAGGGGIDSPGWSDAFDEWVEDEVNPVDTSSPSDSSNTPSWLQKILNGLSTINNTIGSGFTLIRDKIGSIGDKLDSILGFISQDDTDSIEDVWISCYEDSYLYDLYSEFSVVQTALINLANTNAASSVSFTVGLPSWNIPNLSGSGSVNAISSSSITFNFDWYTAPRYSNGDSIRDRIWIVFIPFLIAGFVWRLLSKLPSVFGGQSGLSDGFHKTVDISNAYANRVKD